MQVPRDAQTAKLVAGAAGLGVVLSAAQAEHLLVLLDELDDWNQRMNLTAIRDRDQQIAKHLLDSLSIHAFLRGKRIADIGTGAGFPGLPLALVNPDDEFTLLDSTAKKLRFVEHMGSEVFVHFDLGDVPLTCRAGADLLGGVDRKERGAVHRFGLQMGQSHAFEPEGAGRNLLL